MATILEDGTAMVMPVEIGRRNNPFAKVLAGLKEGERIVLHPSDRVRDGVAVAPATASRIQRFDERLAGLTGVKSGCLDA